MAALPYPFVRIHPPRRFSPRPPEEGTAAHRSSRDGGRVSWQGGGRAGEEMPGKVASSLSRRAGHLLASRIHGRSVCRSRSHLVSSASQVLDENFDFFISDLGLL
ncbi:hypothetical protein BS78_02G117500 [Paspalum vaginatum]|nr:hypothetical protein BS78_02G117500 [Paspalum vaginatum]